MQNLKSLRAVFTRKVIIVSLLLAVFVGQVWLFAYYSSAEAIAAEKVEALTRSIVTAAGANYSRTSAEQDNALIKKSIRRPEVEALHRQRMRASSVVNAAGLTLLIWPLLAVGRVVLAVKRSLANTSVDPVVKHQRSLVVRVLTIAILLVALIVVWRFYSQSMFDRSFDLWLVFALLVLLMSILLIEMLWKLVALGRLRSTLTSFPLSSRIIPQALAVIIVALVMSGDLERVQLDPFMRSEIRSNVLPWSPNAIAIVALVPQVILWTSIVFALGVAAMDYLKLPVSNASQPSGASSQAISAVAAAINDASSSSKQESDLLGGNRLSEEVTRLLKIIESKSEGVNGKSARTNGRALLIQVQDAIRSRSLETRERLIAEVHSLTRRGNLNLTIGSVTSLIAAAILWMLVARAPLQIKSDTFFAYYAPRISVAIFIEVFSFFFLKLYKAGLADIKYYQNELTNLESRFLAVEIASLSNSGDMPALLRDLSSTDRNLILKPGDSTVDLEKMKVEQQDLRLLVENVLKIVPTMVSKPSASAPS